MSLTKHLKDKGCTFSQKEVSPIWDGPESSKDNGGITFSLLNLFLQCRERFRIRVVEGYRIADGFNHRLGYGNMWHICEEAYASEYKHFGEYVGTTLWTDNLVEYCQKLCKQYPTAQPQINHWYNVCLKQFPLYMKYWSNHPDMKNQTPLLQEEKFKVPYTLPSGRTIYLRGKWDSVDLVQKTSKPSGTFRTGKEIWLQENKTKGDVQPELIRKQMTFDLQTMIYIVALEGYRSIGTTDLNHKGIHSLDCPLVGVRYNVIRRPLSGGKGNIKPHQGKPSTRLKSGKMSKAKPAETMESFYNRLAKYIEDEPEHYFLRFNVKLTEEDINKFKVECLNPILEQLCDWWEWIQLDQSNPFRTPDKFIEETNYGIHFRMPFGLRPLEEGMSTELDEYMDSGISVGLERNKELFPELA